MDVVSVLQKHQDCLMPLFSEVYEKKNPHKKQFFFLQGSKVLLSNQHFVFVFFLLGGGYVCKGHYSYKTANHCF